MLKFCCLTKQAIARSSRNVTDGARTLSVLQSAVTMPCPNYGCVGHYGNRPVVKAWPSSNKGKVGHRFLTGFPPSDARGPYTDIYTNGDKG